MKYSLVVVFLFVGSVLAGPFCPGEKCDKDSSGKIIKATCDKCKAKQASHFKCGVFYKDLTRRRPLTWIGAIPDVLNSDNEDSWTEILGPSADPEDFSRFPCDNSTDIRANSRCYTILSPLANKELDTCEDTLLNSRVPKKDTLGNSLCDQAIRFLKPTRRWKKQKIGTEGLKNQQMSFYYSACGGDWKPVHDTATGAPLEVDSDLCCQPSGLYEPCDGTTDYTKSCPQ